MTPSCFTSLQRNQVFLTDSATKPWLWLSVQRMAGVSFNVAADRVYDHPTDRIYSGTYDTVWSYVDTSGGGILHCSILHINQANSVCVDSRSSGKHSFTNVCIHIHPHNNHAPMQKGFNLNKEKQRGWGGGAGSIKMELLLLSPPPRKLQFPREPRGGRRCTHQLIIMHNADSLCTVNHFFNIQRLINHLSTQTGESRLHSPQPARVCVCVREIISTTETQRTGEQESVNVQRGEREEGRIIIIIRLSFSFCLKVLLQRALIRWIWADWRRKEAEKHKKLSCL